MGLSITRQGRTAPLDFDKDGVSFLNEKLLEVESHRNLVVKVERIVASILFVTGAVGLGLIIAFCPYGILFTALLSLFLVIVLANGFSLAAISGDIDKEIVARFTSGPAFLEKGLKEKLAPQGAQADSVKYHEAQSDQTWDYFTSCKEEYDANAERIRLAKEEISRITNVKSDDIVDIIGRFLV